MAKKPFKELSHAGLRQDRLDLYCERIFLEVWQEENVRQAHINGGNTALELILNLKTDKERRPGGFNPGPPFPVTPITQRDADVAATVIQWLGTNCGACFLAEAERRCRKAAEEERQKHHAVNNLNAPKR